MLDQIQSGRYAAWRYPCGTGPIRLLNWNIERGLKLNAIVDFIRRSDPDICTLQEVDLNARRTGQQNVAEVIAAKLGFNYVFGIEFEELSQGSGTARAFQGQATLTRGAISAARILRFSRQSDYWRPRWYLPNLPVFQQRRGGRMALATELRISGRPMVIYNVHLESQDGDDLRLAQLIEIVRDSRRYPQDTPLLIAGDFNTRRMPSPLQQYLAGMGFKDACEDGCSGGTKPTGEKLDWIFARGRAQVTAGKVHRNIRASDHYPLSTEVSLIG